METFNPDPKPGRIVLPLVLIGMIANVNTIPGTPMDPSASLHVQIYICCLLYTSDAEDEG